jgi:hypothetical protein
VEQVDLDELDDEEAPCVALRNMSIGDVCPKESEEPPQAQDQPSSSMQASPPTQDEDQAQDDENKDREDEPPQEENNDQGGDDNVKDKEDEQEITPLTPFLVIFIRGYKLNLESLIFVNITLLCPLLSHRGWRMH